MKLVLTDKGRDYMNEAFANDYWDNEDIEDAANVLSLFEVHGPVIESDKVYELAYADSYKRPYSYDWSQEPINQALVRRIVKQLFEARYLEEVEEYDEDDILLTMNPSAIPLEKAKEMHQQAKWERMRREYRMDKYGEY